MPCFEYYCKSCNSTFEELLTSRADVEKYSQKFGCQCGKWAKRVPSVANAAFKGTPGNSGCHDLDYPVLDKAVGRSAERKWGVYNKRKEVRDKIRKESGSAALTVSGDKAVPTSKDKLVLREKALRTYSNARKSK